MKLTDKKRCSHCGKVKPISDYGIDASRADGLNAECRECRRKRYHENLGGVSHALRGFSNDDLIGEMLRRSTIYDLLDVVPSKDIIDYLKEQGYIMTAIEPESSHTMKGGDE